jgi:hypothetical protein
MVVRSRISLSACVVVFLYSALCLFKIAVSSRVYRQSLRVFRTLGAWTLANIVARLAMREREMRVQFILSIYAIVLALCITQYTHPIYPFMPISCFKSPYQNMLYHMFDLNNVLPSEQNNKDYCFLLPSWMHSYPQPQPDPEKEEEEEGTMRLQKMILRLPTQLYWTQTSVKLKTAPWRRQYKFRCGPIGLYPRPRHRMSPRHQMSSGLKKATKVIGRQKCRTGNMMPAAPKMPAASKMPAALAERNTQEHRDIISRNL